jgi:hypothetical protein
LIVRLFASLSAVLLLGFAVPTWAGSSAPPGVPLSAVGSANGVPALDTNKNLIVPGYQINVANAFAAQNAYHTNAPTTASSGIVTFGTQHMAAVDEWVCSAQDQTSGATYYENVVPTPGNLATEITVTNYLRSSQAATAWPASDIIQFECGAV